jgi:RNA polymerase sigma-70 factor (ECF subfamily)
VFVRVFNRLDEYDPSRPAKPWLFGIAFRVASEHRRLARNRHESLEEETLPDAPDAGPSVIDRLERKQARALVDSALEALSLDHRAVFVLCELDGATAPEMAEILGIPLNTVYSRLRKARAVFSDAVRRLHATGGAS